MMKLEAMKSYIRENNLTHLVKELVTGADMMSHPLLSTFMI